jgi:hypothetical protein
MELNYNVLLKGFLDGEGKLRQYPSKMKAKAPAMYYIAAKFEKGRQYSEAEVNSLINSACSFKDPATIRRDMVDNKFFERTADCRSYKLADTLPVFPELGIC